MNLITEHNPAPDFQLIDHTGKAIRLSEYKGENVILFFYPADFTPACTNEVCAFRDNYKALTKAGYTLIGISPDPVSSHKKFRKEYKLPYLLLSDDDHSVMKAYGVWGMKQLYGREFEGVIRSTFIIDKDGIVVKAMRNVKATGHVERVLREVQALSSSAK